ncbi:MAG: hypothetical protein HRF43_05915 [Phycisphaerae bacterium]|jgi:hypothetical protein
MQRFKRKGALTRRWCRGRFWAAAAVLALLNTGRPVIGADEEEGPDPNDVILVEEDWELVVNEPDDQLETPQFHTVMSPFGHLDSYYAQVLWNYREVEDEFAPGGLQLQSWNGENRLNLRSINGRLLSTEAETITWTQVLGTNGYELAFAIDNGHSETWGEFGRDIRITQNANLENLNAYDTAVSVQNSWVTYGSNRVTSLVIKQVRKYGAYGLISVDTVPKVVYEFADTQDSGEDVAPLEDY